MANRSNPRAFGALSVGLAAVALMAVALASACGGGGTPTLVIVVQPTATQQELSDQARELERFLEERVDVDIVIRFPTSYAGVVEALRFGHADAAFMGAWPAALANEHADAEVVLAEVREVIIGDQKVEEPYYYSYWVVREDSPFQSLEELRGKKAAFPSQISTSGYVAPVARLKELGLIDSAADATADPNDFFGEVFFAGGYSQAWEALKAGQVDVSIIAGDVPEDLYREVLDGTRVIEEQGPIPSHAVVFSEELKEPLRSQLRDALLDLGSDEQRDLMRKFVSGIFIRFEPATTEEHLSSLIGYLNTTRFAFTEQLSNSNPVPVADPDPEPGQGIVQPRPADASQVNVALSEWEIALDLDEVESGPVYFLVSNDGEEPHEFVVVRTDSGPHDLPTIEGRVPEDEIDLLSEIEPFAGGGQASLLVDLAPGRYLFICNMVEFEDGKLESHYELGMSTAFTVR